MTRGLAGAAARLAPIGAGALLLGSTATAQFNNQWLGYSDQTNARLNSAPGVGINDLQEKDYIWGDLDQNGFTDLVSVRKQPVTTNGKFANVLFMNSNGVFTDSTAAFASATNVPGDNGFLTPTNDRDVGVADVDLDGWLDVITSPALSPGDPKHISHPRVYLNQGESGGNWLGLLFDNDRIPQLTTASGTPTTPDFCGVAAGDVDRDGDQDLYFAHYDQGNGGLDMNDKLLINDGGGFFTDESNTRVPSGMLNSSFGTAAYILDLNMDGHNDILKNENGPSDGAWSNATAPGFYSIWDNVYGGASYHVGVGDLNNDGRPDAIFSDDGADRYAYNLGTDPLGRPIWGSNKTFQFLAGGDDGFCSNSVAEDLDGDGWKDVAICDVDVDVGGCGRRFHLYHNPGGTVGQEITLVEERQSSSNGWVGAVGLQPSNLTGSHDVAIFDIENDGDLDMILGRCSGTTIYVNQVNPECATDLGFGGNVRLQVCGGFGAGEVSTIRVDNAPPATQVFVFVSLSSNPTPIPNIGTIVPVPANLLIEVNSTPFGAWQSGPIPGGSGPSVAYVQAMVVDASKPLFVDLSNAVRVEFQP